MIGEHIKCLSQCPRATLSKFELTRRKCDEDKAERMLMYANAEPTQLEESAEEESEEPVSKKEEIEARADSNQFWIFNQGCRYAFPNATDIILDISSPTYIQCNTRSYNLRFDIFQTRKTNTRSNALYET